MYMVHVDVTLNDINSGGVGSTRGCPVALAMRRALDNVEMGRFEVLVGGSSFTLRDTKKSEQLEFRTPQIAEFFIRKFDERRTVSPFQFSFDIHDSQRSHGRRMEFDMHNVYLYGSWDMPKVPQFKSKKPVHLGYGFIEPIKYEKIISLDKDIKEVKEVKEPTIKELEKFINSYEELSPDFALVTVK